MLWPKNYLKIVKFNANEFLIKFIFFTFDLQQFAKRLKTYVHYL